MAKVLIGNIKGPKGEQGPQGIQGIPGPAGADGEIDSNSLIEFVDYEGEGAPQLPGLEESLGKIESNISIGKLMSYVKAFNMNVSNFLKGVVTLGKLANNLTTTEEGFALDARQGSIIAAKNAQLESAIEELNSNLKAKKIWYGEAATGSTIHFVEDIRKYNQLFFYTGGITLSSFILGNITAHGIFTNNVSSISIYGLYGVIKNDGLTVQLNNATRFVLNSTNSASENFTITQIYGL